jgi:uncharacterized protein YjbI with pentapeptide repeats
MSEHTISINLRADEKVIIEIHQISSNRKRRFKELLGCNDKTVYDWLTLLSSILLPFAIAAFTIVITMQENNEQHENREHDLLIAALRREQDQHIAEQQRNETLLSNYLRDISNLILKYGHQLDDHKARITAATVTLTAIQRLNTEKKQFIVRYLYRRTFIDQTESDQPFELKGADLSNIELTNHLIINDHSIRKYNGLFLPFVYLTNASFIYLIISYSNFAHSDLSGANFSYSFIQYGYFKSAQLQNCDFRYADITDIDFTNANLTGAHITDEQLQQAAFLDNVIFPNGSIWFYEKQNSNVLSMSNWIYNGTNDTNIFNRSLIIHQEKRILEDYAKPYWIDRERIGYTLSGLIFGDNIITQILFFNSNGILLQTDRLEKYNTNENYHETNGLCRRSTYLIRIEIIIKPSKDKIFIEYIHLNLTSQYNIHR